MEKLEEKNFIEFFRIKIFDENNLNSITDEISQKNKK